MHGGIDRDSYLYGRIQRLITDILMYSHMRQFFCLIALVLVSACSSAEPKWAADAEVTRAHYVHEGPPTLTLFTVISNKSGAGAHSALMVNSSERAIFDPAGSWYHPNLPERNDVHFGMTDKAVDFYVDYHSRVTYHTVIQEIVVTPEIAALAMAHIKSYGAVSKAQCSKSITDILRRLPGFQSIPASWFPKKASIAFGKLPGVKTRKVYDNDPDKNTGFITATGI